MRAKRALLLFFLLAFVGCSNPYRTAAQLADDLGASINSGATTVHGLEQQKLITAGEDRAVLGYLDTANILNGKYIECVAGVHAAGDKVDGFIGCADTLLAQLKTPQMLNSLRIVNPDAQAKVQTIAAGIQTVIDGAELALKKVKGA